MAGNDRRKGAEKQETELNRIDQIIYGNNNKCPMQQYESSNLHFFVTQKEFHQLVTLLVSLLDTEKKFNYYSCQVKLYKVHARGHELRKSQSKHKR